MEGSGNQYESVLSIFCS